MLNQFYTKMFDLYIEQADNSATVSLYVMRDMQSVYMGGIRMALKAGQALEKRSKLKLPLMRETVDFIEAATPAIMKAQYDLATASFNTNLNMVKSIREYLAADTYAENKGDRT